MRPNALLADFSKAGEIHHLPVDGGGVNFEVAGVDNVASGRADTQSAGVGDRVVAANDLHREAAGLHHVAIANLVQLGAAQQAMLLQLAADQAAGRRVP